GLFETRPRLANLARDGEGHAQSCLRRGQIRPKNSCLVMRTQFASTLTNKAEQPPRQQISLGSGFLDRFAKVRPGRTLPLREQDTRPGKNEKWIEFMVLQRGFAREHFERASRSFDGGKLMTRDVESLG